jgi:hypothetical protein
MKENDSDAVAAPLSRGVFFRAEAATQRRGYRKRRNAIHAATQRRGYST